MCTVKLSRQLYPHHDGHSLDAIMRVPILPFLPATVPWGMWNW
jgi:hypothetical protein